MCESVCAPYTFCMFLLVNLRIVWLYCVCVCQREVFVSLCNCKSTIMITITCCVLESDQTVYHVTACPVVRSVSICVESALLLSG